MADKHGTISESKAICDKLRNYENHTEKAGEGDEQGAGDDPAGSEAAAGGARGRPVAVRGGRRRDAGYGGAEGEPVHEVRGNRESRDRQREKSHPEVVAGIARRIDGPMTTAIDTNILVTLWDVEDTLHRPARQALEAAFEQGSLVIAGAVYAELLPSPGRTEDSFDLFSQETGIGVEWELSEEVWRAAGLAFPGYAARLKKQKVTHTRRVLADFLLGAHAAGN